MANHYYLAASLPSLDFDSKPHITSEVFLEDCQRLLSETDFDLIRSLFSQDLSDSPSVMTHPVLSAYGSFERDLKNEGVIKRAAKWDIDPQKYIRGERPANPVVSQLVESALKESDLIYAEKLIDKARWELLSSLEVGHYFDLTFIAIYAIKLKLIERWQNFTSPQGKEIWKDMRQFEIPQELIV